MALHIKLKRELKILNLVYFILIVGTTILLLFTHKLHQNYGLWMRLIFCLWIPFSCVRQINEIGKYRDIPLAGRQYIYYWFLVLMGNLCLITSAIYYIYEMFQNKETFASMLLALAYLTLISGISIYLKKIKNGLNVT